MAVKEKKDNSDGYKRLKSELSGDGPGRLYLFWGEEVYLREYYLSQLKKKLISEEMEQFNFHALPGEKLNIQELKETLDSLPVFSERTLVVVTDCDIYKLNKDAREKLEELLCDLPDYCCLVFVYDVAEYKPVKTMKLFAAMQDNGLVVEFARQKQSDMIAWIKRRFGAVDKAIDTKMCEYLIFLCGGLMTNLVSEIAKIAAYAKGKEVGKNEIDAVATPVLDAVIFNLTDAVTERRYDKALEILHELLEMKYEPVVLMAAVGRQLRQVYSARLVLQERKTARDLAELWGFRSPYPAERLLKAAGGVTLTWCRSAVRLCAMTDLELKSGSSDKQRTLELFVARLSTGGSAA